MHGWNKVWLRAYLFFLQIRFFNESKCIIWIHNFRKNFYTWEPFPKLFNYSTIFTHSVDFRLSHVNVLIPQWYVRNCRLNIKLFYNILRAIVIISLVSSCFKWNICSRFLNPRVFLTSLLSSSYLLISMGSTKFRNTAQGVTQSSDHACENWYSSSSLTFCRDHASWWIHFSHPVKYI